MDYLTLVSFNVLPIVALCIINSRLIVTLRKVVDQDLVARGSFATEDDTTGDATIESNNGAGAINIARCGTSADHGALIPVSTLPLPFLPLCKYFLQI